jgi:hypothetical protein
MSVDRLCSLCEEVQVERPATHTYYTENNTMSWCCDPHATEILRDAHAAPSEWVGSKLVPTVEESDPERRERLKRTNLLQFPLRAVS